MSRKSRERREKNKTVRPDDYFSNGTFEMARFGKNTIVRNNRTPEQHAAQMEYLRAEYASKYEDIAQKVKSLKEKVTQCDPYSLLMYLRSLATMGQMNIFSEIEYSSDANAIIRAQEYVQSILVAALGECAALWVYHHIGRMSLQKLGREPETGLTRA